MTFYARRAAEVARIWRAALATVHPLIGDAILTATMCVCLWLCIGLVLHQQHADLLRDAAHDTDNLARAFQENTIRTVDAVDRTLLFLRAAYAADPAHFSLATWQTGAQAVDDLTFQLAITNSAGRLIASNLGPVSGRLDLSDREHIRVQITSTQDRLFISAPVLGRESGKWSIQFTRRIAAADGALLGVAVVSLDPYSLARFYASLDIGRGSVLLVGLDGIVRAEAPVGVGAMGRNVAGSPLLVAAQAAPSGTYTSLGTNLPKQIRSFRRLDRYGLIVAVGEDYKQVLTAYFRNRDEYMAGGAVLTLLILLVASNIVRRRLLLLSTQRTLVRSQQVLTDTLENMSQGIFMVDRQRRIAVINRRAIELLGLPEDLVGVGTPFRALLRWQEDHPSLDAGAPARLLPEPAELDAADSVYERAHPNGTALEVRTRRLVDHSAVYTLTDITERRRAASQIVYLAHHDGLTGLANRRFFHERLAHAIVLSQRTGARFAVLCLDLDRFKQVNDARGHDIGDRLLRIVAERLACSVREGDTVARFGGDEFAILQTSYEQPAGAAALAERLAADLAEPYAIDDIQLVIGVSIGIALYPSDGLSADHLLKSADIALYEAKQDGRGKYRFFEAEMDHKLQEQYALERDLRDAIARDGLAVHYQPICEADSGRVLAFEALARWTHPQRGRIAPDLFVPLAEETNLIGALGRRVLRSACRAATQWPPHVRLTVNLSPRQFLEPDLDRQIIGVLDETGLEPDRLSLEVTEGVLIRNSEEALGAMHVLQRRGVRIYLDDFGSGHAGLSYLLRFPFDCIKIDRSFVARLATDRAAEAVIRATLLVGELLELEVIAEGVETEQQRALLRDLGCHQIQGFLLDRPVPADRITDERLRDGYARRPEATLPDHGG